MSSVQPPDDFSLRSQMHGQIRAVSFAMFSAKGFNKKHMFLLLELIPVTHKVCFPETLQELSIGPSCPNSKDPFGYDWSLSPEGTGTLWMKGKSRERGHSIDTTPQKRLPGNDSNVEIRVLDSSLGLFMLQHKAGILRQSLLTLFYNAGTEPWKGCMTFLLSKTFFRVEI